MVYAMSIHRDVIADNPRFIQKVIKLPATQNDQRRDTCFINKVTLKKCVNSSKFHELLLTMQFNIIVCTWLS
jgi:hypothetical protein